jgi:hypothetical protein
MTEDVVRFGIATLCVVWIPLGVIALKLRRKVVTLRATVKILQNQVDQLAERNLLLVLNRREGAFGLMSSPKSESTDVLPLKLPIAPSVVGSR